MPRPTRFSRHRIAVVGTLGVVAALLVGLTPSAAVGAPQAAALVTSAPVPVLGDYLVVGRDRLASLPTSGAAWTSMVKVADGDLGTPLLSDQDNRHAGQTVAAALVFARTGKLVYRDKVVTELRELQARPGLSGARVLSVARQLGGYAIAADLVGYRDPGFVSLLGGLRTKDVGGHGRWFSVTQTSEDTSSNWGGWALASRIAVSRYVGDTADVERAARVFRGFTGDRSAYAGFRTTADFDPAWACNPTAWVPINPASCGDRAGALVEDISRSSASYPSVDDTGRTYSWEALGGLTLSATLLQGAGHADVWQWGDKALLRAAQFLHRKGGYPAMYSTNQYIPWAINNAYGVTLGPLQAAGHGRQFGYTDWLR